MVMNDYVCRYLGSDIKSMVQDEKNVQTYRHMHEINFQLKIVRYIVILMKLLTR